ncbi:MAG TPA: hypothetical protein VF163_11765 [Micromonosporaceae bacterium]
MTGNVRRLVGLLVLAVAAGLVGACARPAQPPLVWPSAGEPIVVASMTVGGGFVPYSWHLMEPPRITVYADGAAVVDASKVLTLSQVEVSDLVRALREDLDGLGPTVEPGGGMQVSDAPTSVLRVRDEQGELTAVSAYALGILTSYPKRLLRARDRFGALAKRVEAGGTGYTSDRVRIVVEPRADQPASGLWPTGLALPPWREGGSLRTADLTGSQALAVAAALPDQDWRSGSWPVLTGPDGQRYAVGWRYLLPEE